jgi:hypothetical protein
MLIPHSIFLWLSNNGIVCRSYYYDAGSDVNIIDGEDEGFKIFS